MLSLFSDGSLYGTIGGGSTEFSAVNDAKSLSADTVKTYEVTGSGSITVLFKYIPSNGYYKELFKNIITAFDENTEKFINFDIKIPLTLTQTASGLYSEHIGSRGKVYIFGGGHVAQKLAKLLYELDFITVIYEDRTQFANPDFFPYADKIISAPYGDILKHISLLPNDYAVIVTRGRLFDYECLKAALKSDIGYIGILGSRRKLEAVYEMLKDDGIDETEFNRVHSPIGIPIQSETPMEVAVSIAAQIIKISHSG